MSWLSTGRPRKPSKGPGEGKDLPSWNAKPIASWATPGAILPTVLTNERGTGFLEKEGRRLLLIKQGGLTPEEVEQVDKEVSEAIEEAVRYAEESPQPDLQVALQDIYA